MSLKEILAIVVTADGSGAIKEFEKVGSTAERELGKAEAGTARTGAAMQKYGAIAVGVGALLIGASLKAAQAAGDQEQADLKLSNTIRQMPQLAGASMSAFLDQAQALQKTTAASDEAVEAGQGLLGQFGLTQQQILQLTPLMNDYAQKSGKDMESAAKDIGKALEGKMKALDGSGVRIDKVAYASDRYRAVVDGLSRSVGGFAEDQGKTMAGQLEIIKHQGDEAAESIGRGVVPILGKAAGVAKTAGDAFEGLPEPLKEAAGTAIAGGGALLVFGGAASMVIGQVLKMKAAMAAAKVEDEAMGSSFKGLAPAAIAAGVAMGVIIAKVGEVRAAEAAAADEANDKWAKLDFGNARKQHDELVAKQKQLSDAMNDTNVAGRVFSRLGEGAGMDTLEKELDGVNRQLEQSDPAFAEAAKRTDALGKASGLTQAAVEGLLGQLGITPDALNNIADQAKVADVLKRLSSGAITAAQAQSELASATAASGDAASKSADQIDEDVANTKKMRDAAMGVISAKKAQEKAVDDVAKSQRDAEKAQRDVVEAERDAVKAAEAITDAKRAETKAYEHIQEARDAVVEAGKKETEAEQALVESHQKVQEATDNVAKAEQKLNDIRANSVQYELDKAKAAESVAESADKVADAEKALAKARATGSGDDVKKAQLALDKAKNDQSQAKLDQAKAGQKQQQDEQAAQESLASAIKSVADAKRDEQHAGEAVVAAQKDIVKAAGAVKDAQYDATKATEAVRDAEHQAAQAGDRVRDAQQGAADAASHVKDAQNAATDAAIALADKTEALNTAYEANPDLAGRVVEQLQAIAANSPAAADGIQNIINTLLGPTPADAAAADQHNPPPATLRQRAKGGVMPAGESFEVHDNEIVTMGVGGGATIRSKGMADALGYSGSAGAGVSFHIGSIQGSDPYRVIDEAVRRANFDLLAAARG